MDVMNTNFFGAVNVTNAVLPHMRDRREGCVVFIGSRSTFRNQKIVRVLPSNTVTSGSRSHTGIQPPRGSVRSLYWTWQSRSTHPGGSQGLIRRPRPQSTVSLPALRMGCANQFFLAYAETLAVEVASFNVKVLIVIPGSFNTKLNAVPRTGTPLQGYESARAGMDAAFKSLVNAPKGDPALAMDVLVDVIRGEGRAVGRNSLPLWLFLGEDCMRDVRDRLDHIGSVVNEWEDVGTRLGLPEAAL